MSVMQWAMLAVSIPTAMAYACRVGAMDKRRHRLGAIGWHLALGAVAVWAAGQAVTGPSVLDAVALACPVLWIMASYHDWRHDVPWWVERMRPSWFHHVRQD